MKRESHEERSSSEEILSKGRRRVLGAMLASTVLLVAAPHIEKGIDHFKNIPNADKQELKSDTVSYTVEESGSLWSIAAYLGVEDATYAADVLEDLNPEFSDARIVPSGTDLIIPRKYVAHESSIDLDSNTAIIVKH